MSLREIIGEKIVIWPSYLDSKITRRKGRKIPLEQAVRSPKVEEIEEAARRLGLDVEVVNKCYPRRWWSEKECVIVEKRGSKLRTLRLIAEEIKRIRGES